MFFSSLQTLSRDSEPYLRVLRLLPAYYNLSLTLYPEASLSPSAHADSQCGGYLPSARLHSSPSGWKQPGLQGRSLPSSCCSFSVPTGVFLYFKTGTSCPDGPQGVPCAPLSTHLALCCAHWPCPRIWIPAQCLPLCTSTWMLLTPQTWEGD